MKNSFIFCLLFVYAFCSSGQDKTLKFEAQLIVDNDLFTGDLEIDQYYSSGIYASFRHLLDSSEKTKIIRSYTLNHQMYTPSWIGETIPEFNDRPYAGVLSFTFTQEYFFANGHYFRPQIEIGWLGPKNLVGKSQSAWHGALGIPKPMGWKYQIKDSPLLGLNLKHIYSYGYMEGIDFSGEATLKIGTVYDLARYDLILRIGKIKPLIESAYLQGVLGKTNKRNPHRETTESYFFYSPGLERVFYNATLEGNIIGEESTYTMEAIKYVWQHRAGVMFSWPIFDLGIIAYWRSKENEEADKHKYVGLRYTQRF
ncbi:MAG: lipid A deacylase LpxR family protein [Cyclobacteriaceae bacterium]